MHAIAGGPALRWLALLAASALFVSAFDAADLAGAGLMGPMVAAVVLSTHGRSVHVPVAAFT